MKILYTNLTAPFSPKMMYKENYLIHAFDENNDKVLILSSLEEYRENQIYINDSGKYNLNNNVVVWRIPFCKLFNGFITKKIRKIQGFIKIVTDFAPDIMILNGIQFYNIQDLKRIKDKLPAVKIYGDVSAAAYNSATNWLSYHILHKGFYRFWLEQNFKYFDKIFYVSEESKLFLKSMYNAPESLLEEQGLCCEAITKEEKYRRKEAFLKKHALSKKSIIFTHTGKMDKVKNTIPLLKEFLKSKNNNFCLILAGAFDPEISEEALQLINKDHRITFLGFLNYTQLMDLLSATDIYVQPGGPSQTLQTAIGCLDFVIVKRMKIYEDLLGDSGIYIETSSDLGNIFSEIGMDKEYLREKMNGIVEIAQKIDYKNIAARFYENERI